MTAREATARGAPTPRALTARGDAAGDSQTPPRRPRRVPVGAVYLGIAIVSIVLWMPNFAKWGVERGTVAGQTSVGKSTVMGARVVMAVEYAFAAVLMYMIPDVRATPAVRKAFQDWGERGRAGTGRRRFRLTPRLARLQVSWAAPSPCWPTWRPCSSRRAPCCCMSVRARALP